jgi:hypothetical protein
MLSPRLLLSSLLAVIALGACDSKVTSLLDTNLQAKLETVTKCIPPQMAKLKEIIDFANLWRQNDVNDPPDPAGLVWSFDGTKITYTIGSPTLSAFTISGIIQFYGPTGQSAGVLVLSEVSLAQAIDDAATELRSLFTLGRPYMVCEMTFAGANCSSTGGTTSPASLTGHIAGLSNQNELEEVQTTEGTAQATSGPPPLQSFDITTEGSETCVFSFTMPSLLTDQDPEQEYPAGTITWSLTNQTASVTVAGTLVFDGTVTAVLDVTGVGMFSINTETQDVTLL